MKIKLNGYFVRRTQPMTIGGQVCMSGRVTGQVGARTPPPGEEGKAYKLHFPENQKVGACGGDTRYLNLDF